MANPESDEGLRLDVYVPRGTSVQLFKSDLHRKVWIRTKKPPNGGRWLKRSRGVNGAFDRRVRVVFVLHERFHVEHRAQYLDADRRGVGRRLDPVLLMPDRSRKNSRLLLRVYL